MKRLISKPYKVHYLVYALIVLISLLTLTVVLIIPQEVDVSSKVEVFFDVVKNLSYGCIASTLVAFIIDLVNVKNLNGKAQLIYDAVYVDLKVGIGHFLGVFAENCAVVFKNENYYQQQHNWEEWYKITKENFQKEKHAKQKNILEFLRERVTFPIEYVNKTINTILSQQYILRANEVINSKLVNILRDIEFEFRALGSHLSSSNWEAEFWTFMDATLQDLKGFVDAWVDIKDYNDKKFNPFDFFGIKLLKVEKA